MPFPNQVPRVFTRANIEAIQPGTMGVYGLFREGTWVYVGRGDIRDRLGRHLNGDNPVISAERPTHYVDVITDDHVALEVQLILELNPICNRRLG